MILKYSTAITLTLFVLWSIEGRKVLFESYRPYNIAISWRRPRKSVFSQRKPFVVAIEI